RGRGEEKSRGPFERAPSFIFPVVSKSLFPLLSKYKGPLLEGKDMIADLGDHGLAEDPGRSRGNGIVEIEGTASGVPASQGFFGSSIGFGTGGNAPEPVVHDGLKFPG